MLTLEFKLDEAIEVWKEEAFEDGVEKGKRENKIEVAQNLLKMGLSAEQVALGTGLSVEEVTRCL